MMARLQPACTITSKWNAAIMFIIRHMLFFTVECVEASACHSAQISLSQTEGASPGSEPRNCRHESRPVASSQQGGGGDEARAMKLLQFQLNMLKLQTELHPKSSELR